MAIFSGTVQGVGFRYTTCRVAAGFDVTGTVRNCPDGTVEVVAEGRPDEIDRFLAAVEHAMRGYVHHVEQETLPVSGAFRDFGVRF